MINLKTKSDTIRFFDQLAEQKNERKIWILYFFNEACPHCQMFRKTFNKFIISLLARSLPLGVVRVEGDAIARASKLLNYAIEGTPTLLVLVPDKKTNTYAVGEIKRLSYHVELLVQQFNHLLQIDPETEIPRPTPTQQSVNRCIFEYFYNPLHTYDPSNLATLAALRLLESYGCKITIHHIHDWSKHMVLQHTSKDLKTTHQYKGHAASQLLVPLLTLLCS